MAYDPSWKPRRDKGKDDPVEPVSAKNFIQACELVMREDEAIHKQPEEVAKAIAYARERLEP